MKKTKEILRLCTNKGVVVLDVAILKKQFGVKRTRQLIHAAENSHEFCYAKTVKKYNPELDYIAFYVTKNAQYETIKLSDLAKAAILEESDYKKYIPKKKVGEAVAKSKKKQAQEEKLAKLKYVSTLLHSGLTKIPLLTILERNYWITFSISKLGCKPPTGEEDIDDRLIKTIKIYAIAYYVGHRVPVQVARTILNHLNVFCPTIREVAYNEREEALTNSSTLEKESDDTYIRKISKAEVKCQTTYLENSYIPATLVTGYEENFKDVGEEKAKTIAKLLPVADDNIAFVVKHSNLIETEKGVDDSTKSELLIYIPGSPLNEIVTQGNLAITDLIKIAYQIAISINYTIARLDVRN